VYRYQVPTSGRYSFSVCGAGGPVGSSTFAVVQGVEVPGGGQLAAACNGPLCCGVNAPIVDLTEGDTVFVEVDALHSYLLTWTCPTIFQARAFPPDLNTWGPLGLGRDSLYGAVQVLLTGRSLVFARSPA
jgi:hypothetical protein